MVFKIVMASILIILGTPIPSYASNCTITLEVLRKQGMPTLGHGVFEISSHDVILKPINTIDKRKECAIYHDVKEIRLNNVEQHDVIFQNLAAGDNITGTVNYHRPSPHGKMLYENYHHGLRIMTIQKSGSNKIEDYKNQYIYFRHIGLY